MKIDLRDIHAYGGLILASLGAGLGWSWLVVLGGGLFYIAVRRIK